MGWLGNSIAVVLTGLGFVIVYWGMKYHQDTGCPHCGSARRWALWGDIWTCRVCKRPYRVGAVSSARLGKVETVELARVVSENLMLLPALLPELADGMAVHWPIYPDCVCYVREGVALIELRSWARDVMIRVDKNTLWEEKGYVW